MATRAVASVDDNGGGAAEGADRQSPSWWFMAAGCALGTLMAVRYVRL